MPPLAPSTWIGTSGPRWRGQVVEGGGDLRHRLVGAVVGRAEDGHDADRVLVAVGHRGLGGEKVATSGRPARGGLRRRSSGRTSPSTPARSCPSRGSAGPLGSPAACARLRQRHLSASPPSMHASLDPVVEQPVASSSSVACHRRPSMLQHRRSISAVCGYSSLSIMFFGEHSAMSCSASRLHPRGDERRQVQPGVAVEHQLVVNDLVGRVAAAWCPPGISSFGTVAFSSSQNCGRMDNSPPTSSGRYERAAPRRCLLGRRRPSSLTSSSCARAAALAECQPVPAPVSEPRQDSWKAPPSSPAAQATASISSSVTVYRLLSERPSSS